MVRYVLPNFIHNACMHVCLHVYTNYCNRIWKYQTSCISITNQKIPTTCSDLKHQVYFLILETSYLSTKTHKTSSCSNKGSLFFPLKQWTPKFLFQPEIAIGNESTRHKNMELSFAQAPSPPTQGFCPFKGEVHMKPFGRIRTSEG